MLSQVNILACTYMDVKLMLSRVNTLACTYMDVKLRLFDAEDF